MAEVKDVFEIKGSYGTGHVPGVVAVLDRALARDLTALTGKTAIVSTPRGTALSSRICVAKDHGVATSLFFQDLTSADIPVGSRIAIEVELLPDEAPSTLPAPERCAQSGSWAHDPSNT